MVKATVAGPHQKFLCPIREAAAAQEAKTSNLMTVSEVATFLNMKQDKVYSLAREGILPTVRLARQIRFSRDALEKFINEGGKPLSGGWRKEEQ